MRMSYWSSDVCSPDLKALANPAASQAEEHPSGGQPDGRLLADPAVTCQHLRQRPGRHDPVQRRAGHGIGKHATDLLTGEPQGQLARPAVVVVKKDVRQQRRKPENFEIGTPGDEICAALRSEEHTSELQSLMRISYAVFCL